MINFRSLSISKNKLSNREEKSGPNLVSLPLKLSTKNLTASDPKADFNNLIS